MLGTDGQIKESQWQGTDFTYPAVRLGNDIIPNDKDCPPDTVEGTISVFTEEKSSKRCSQISSEIAKILHRTSFTSAVNGVKFIRITVTRVTYPNQLEDMSIWQSQVQITALVS
jgi:hypothetical protein